MLSNDASSVRAALLRQARFLHSYFEQSVIDLRTVSSYTSTVPYLDYLYDKELQHMTDARRGIVLAGEPDTATCTRDYMSAVDTSIISTGHLLSDQLSCNQRTIYRFRVDQQLTDHSSHYTRAFLPFYRFGPTRSFSDAIGVTMRLNIRQLYDLVRRILGRDDICPCVILYNLFIRDSFRLFSLVSTQHCNYVCVLDDEASSNERLVAVVSYVELSNAFPQVSQWFPKINSQYVRKYGPHSLKRLEYYASLLEEAASQSLPATRTSSTVSAVAAGVAARELTTGCFRSDGNTNSPSSTGKLVSSNDIDTAMNGSFTVAAASSTTAMPSPALPAPSTTINNNKNNANYSNSNSCSSPSSVSSNSAAAKKKTKPQRSRQKRGRAADDRSPVPAKLAKSVDRESVAANASVEISAVFTATPPSIVPTTNTTSASTTSAGQRPRLESLFRPPCAPSSDPHNDDSSPFLLDRLFRTDYAECPHSKLLHVYVQLRSRDESATLILRCANCGKRM